MRQNGQRNWVFGMIFLLLVLSATVFADDPKDVSICDIQKYNGVAEGDRVRITGVVIGETGRYGSQTTILSEQGGGPWCAIWVYVPDEDLVALQGECATVVGVVQEYYDKTEIFVGSEETERPEVESSCFPEPDPMLINTTELNEEMYESCLVEVRCAVCTEGANEGNFWVFKIDDGSGPCHSVFSPSWEYDPVEGDEFCWIRGINDYAYDLFRIRPRTKDEYDTTPLASCSYCGTPPPCDDPLVLDVALSKEQPNCFIPGDAFLLTASMTNPCPDPITIDFYLVLDVFGSYYFYPQWNQTLESKSWSIPGNGSDTLTILEFTWPSGAGSAQDIAFYGLGTTPGTYDMASNLDVATFCFQ